MSSSENGRNINIPTPKTALRPRMMRRPDRLRSSKILFA
jgi:hypothetical protein